MAHQFVERSSTGFQCPSRLRFVFQRRCEPEEGDGRSVGVDLDRAPYRQSRREVRIHVESERGDDSLATDAIPEGRKAEIRRVCGSFVGAEAAADHLLCMSATREIAHNRWRVDRDDDVVVDERPQPPQQILVASHAAECPNGSIFDQAYPGAATFRPCEVNTDEAHPSHARPRRNSNVRIRVESKSDSVDDAIDRGIVLARMEPRQARSVRHLQNLYAVVVAVALTVAVERLLPLEQAIGTEKLPLFVALLATLIPFYHGTLRHLDDVYIERRELDRRETALLFDFFALFLESCILLGLAASITRPHFFAWTFVALLVVDISWATVTAEYFKTGNGIMAHRDWVQVNAVTVVLLVILLVATDLSDGWTFKALVLTLALARTLADYASSWRFYAGIDDAPRRSEVDGKAGHGPP